jgi:hypothetical protein
LGWYAAAGSSFGTSVASSASSSGGGSFGRAGSGSRAWDCPCDACGFDGTVGPSVGPACRSRPFREKMKTPRPISPTTSRNEMTFPSPVSPGC